jgi:hypothetical protein
VPGRDDLDSHFREHPRLKKYADMFDEQHNRGIANQQRMAWAVLLLVAMAAYYVMAAKTGTWNPLDWKVFWPWHRPVM